MNDTDEWDEDFEIDTTSEDLEKNATPAKPLTRTQALRNKLKALRGRDPDIYPMW